MENITYLHGVREAGKWHKHGWADSSRSSPLCIHMSNPPLTSSMQLLQKAVELIKSSISLAFISAASTEVIWIWGSQAHLSQPSFPRMLNHTNANIGYGFLLKDDVRNSSKRSDTGNKSDWVLLARPEFEQRWQSGLETYQWLFLELQTRIVLVQVCVQRFCQNLEHCLQDQFHSLQYVRNIMMWENCQCVTDWSVFGTVSHNAVQPFCCVLQGRTHALRYKLYTLMLTVLFLMCGALNA